MPFRSRLTPLAALSAVLALAGCDSNSSNSALDALDGTYSVAELTFDPQPGALDDVDVNARLRASATRLQIFGDDGDVLFQSQFDDASGSRRTNLTATATRGRVSFTAVTVQDEQELADLFLPRQFTLTYNAESRASDLSGTISLNDVDLESFDPEQYGGLPPVDGTLRVRFTPVAD
ncbi:MAG TPA: hypothetical protein VF576_12025 [Rubricoccaceae bacterium]|jgi:hypothetical protein